MRAARDEDAIAAKQQAPMMKARFKVLWEALSDDERQAWDEKASALSEAEKEGQLYRYVPTCAGLSITHYPN